MHLYICYEIIMLIFVGFGCIANGYVLDVWVLWLARSNVYSWSFLWSRVTFLVQVLGPVSAIG